MSASASAITGGSTAQAETIPVAETRSNERLGMMLFLVSEAIMFAALFGQYFYSRSQLAVWPPEGYEKVPAVPLALVLTVILAVSGFTAHWAQNAIKKGDREKTSAWLAVTIALGVVFLSGQAYEYVNLLAGHGIFGEPDFHPFGINSGIYGSAFFTLTGLHGLHVTGGVLALCVMLGRNLAGHFSARNHFGFEGTVLYWHFVDIVWFVLYAAIYLF